MLVGGLGAEGGIDLPPVGGCLNAARNAITFWWKGKICMICVTMCIHCIILSPCVYCHSTFSIPVTGYNPNKCVTFIKSCIQRRMYLEVSGIP